jgi:hypothetical protein
MASTRRPSPSGRSASPRWFAGRAQLFRGRQFWARSRLIDNAFIARYAKLRVQVLDDNPILRHTVEQPRNLNKAEYFFLEVGAGSGPPGARHQVEFPEALARLFGPVHRGPRLITLTDSNHVWNNRPLSYKTTTYGVEIWRLGMPTLQMGGVPISERVIQFTKTPKDNTYGIEVVDTHSAEFRCWTTIANVSGHLGTTMAQRSLIYGFTHSFAWSHGDGVSNC